MKNKILIAYYSWSGNTKKVAQIIQQKTDADLFELVPIKEYSQNYSECLNRARKEINANEIPELKSISKNLDEYKTIVIGSPNWCSTIAPPVLSFLKQNDFSGKKIIPFLTHGGGGKGHFLNDVKAAVKNAEVLQEITFYGDGGSSAKSEISGWIDGLLPSGL